MNLLAFAGGYVLLLGLLVLGKLECLAASSQIVPSSDDIIKRAVERSQGNDKRNQGRQITYTKLGLMEEIDRKGKVKTREEKLYAVRFHADKVQMKLLRLNGANPSDRQIQNEAEEDIESRKREDARSPRAEERPLYLTPELVAKYEFTFLERQMVNGRSSFALSFQAKPGLVAKGIADRFLNQIAGKIWIDEQDFEIARAEVHLRSPVTLWGGVLGAMKRFDYSLERTRLEQGIWFNRVSKGDFELRKLFDARRIRTRSEWSQVDIQP